MRLPPMLRSVLVLAAAFSTGCYQIGDVRSFAGYEVKVLADPDDPKDFEFILREALLTARPGTLLELPEGHFPIENELTLGVSHVALRGKGAERTVLDFTDQDNGAQSLKIRADEFAMIGIAVINPQGDGVRVERANGAIFDDVRVEWLSGPSPDNGPYGIYPVESSNVLIQNSEVVGAADAGIYVGQSDKIILRANRVRLNVLGIELENSTNGDIYYNDASLNTGGIAVLDLPGLPKQGGGRVRVFRNWIGDNQTPNFARPGSTVAMVPGGLGVLIMANRDVEVFGNWIVRHQSVNLGVASYKILDGGIPEPQQPGDFDPYPERIFIHDNHFGPAGWDPMGDLGFLLRGVFWRLGARPPKLIPDVAWDGFTRPAYAGVLPPDRNLCLSDNVSEVGDLFGSMNGELFTLGTRNVTPHLCEHESLPEVVLDPPLPIPPPGDEYSPEEVAALCGAGGSGPNWDAHVVDCEQLADYRLFEGADPRFAPSPPGVPFDLTTPLFSDYAVKHRFIFVPPGTQAAYREDRAFDFPVGTIIAKTFSFENLQAGTTRVLETRLLIHRESGWVGLPYVWNEAGTVATLERGGYGEDVTFTHPDGDLRTVRYRVPDVNNCVNCHAAIGADPGSAPIGPKARLLNRDFDYPDLDGLGPVNQLTRWTQLGILEGAPEDPADAPRLPFWDDPTDGSLELRARAYLESNCAHCHSQAGAARATGLWLDIGTEPRNPDGSFRFNYGFCKGPIAAGAGSGSLLEDIVPGSAAESILVFRMASADPAVRMPELSKAIAHDAGVALVAEWINSLTPEGCD